MFHELCHQMKNIFTVPSVEALALRELEESMRRLLDAQSSREYADSMCKYYEAKIKRLTTYLQDLRD